MSAASSEEHISETQNLWLPEGTLLTADMLPTELNTYLQYPGVDRWSKIAMSWDLDGYNGQTDGDLILTGVFQDEDGNSMSSVQPLTITVHWYEPDTIVITDATWENHLHSLSAILTAEKPPEYVDDIWGEVSNDCGKTWDRWDDLTIVDNEGFWTCIFICRTTYRVIYASQRQLTQMNLNTGSLKEFFRQLVSTTKAEAAEEAHHPIRLSGRRSR